MLDKSLMEDKILISSADFAEEHSLLKRLKVEMIINCAPEIKNYFEDDFVYYRIDWATYPIASVNVINKIKEIETKLDGKVVLCHCWRGEARAPAAAFLLLLAKGKSFFDSMIALPRMGSIPLSFFIDIYMLLNNGEIAHEKCSEIQSIGNMKGWW